MTKCARRCVDVASRRLFAVAARKRKKIAREAGKRARHQMAERSHRWRSRVRCLLIRWEKNPEQYLAFLHFACGLIAIRAAGLFG